MDYIVHAVDGIIDYKGEKKPLSYSDITAISAACHRALLTHLCRLQDNRAHGAARPMLYSTEAGEVAQQLSTCWVSTRASWIPASCNQPGMIF